MIHQQNVDANDIQNVRRFVAFIGLYIILVSQFLVFSKPVEETLLLPPYTWLALIGIFFLVFSRFLKATPLLKKYSERRFFSDRVFWIVAGVLFSALGALATFFFATYTRVNYIPVITVWLLGAGSYMYAFLQAGERAVFVSVQDWFKKHRTEIILVLLITVAAFAVRFYKLGDVPRVLDGDEGAVGLTAQLTNEGVLSNPFALWDNFGALYLQLINFSLKIFGINAFALRLIPAIGGVLAIPSIYLLGRQIGGWRVGLIAAFLIAFSHSHIHFSRIASVAYIQGAWLAPLELYLLLSGLEKRQAWRTALGGVLLAIHFSVYLTAQIVAGMLVVYVVLGFLFYRDWFKSRAQQVAAFFGGFFITILPAGLYYFQQPNEFMNRLNKDGTFQSGWLENTMLATGQSAVEVLFGRVTHAFLSLIYYPALDFYGSPAPMLSMISTVMFLAGLGIALWRLKNPAYLLLNGYFWAATVAVGLFAVPPGADSYRMLMALPAAMIMAALGLEEILEMFGITWQTKRVAYGVSVGIIFASLMAFNLWTYYFDFAGRCRFASDTAGRFASYLGSQVAEIDSEEQIYLLSDAIFIHGTHPSSFFLSKSRQIQNFNEPIDQLNPVSGEVIIAPPSRIEELELWARANPGGDLRYQYDCTDPILLLYQVP
jgi:hypothetical protein